MTEECKTQLEAIVGADNIKYDEPMKIHTTFRIGGPADIFIIPADTGSLIAAIAYCKQMGLPWVVIGNGSNLLVGDRGIRGVVFCLFHTMDEVRFEPMNTERVAVTAGAGIMLSRLAKTVADYGLCGFEFAAGIPGTFGGAIAMNAGAYGGEMKHFLVYARVLTPEGELLTLNQRELDLSYRHSILLERGYIALEAALMFRRGNKEAIYARMEELAGQRKSKQPLEYPSAGSTFKRPEGYFAGKLIQDAGLKGYRVGGAQVSEKHSGFVINTGAATANDVKRLIHDVQQKVFEAFGVRMETEVRMLGEF